ncbi:MAG: hypothetical protein KDE58_42910 [Caldilineaceae bacterium]|nr:hypothetical protein [Caldilineaceae bacterium]
MKNHWQMYYSRAVADYLIQLGDAGRDLRRIVALLAEYGVPANAVVDEGDMPATYTWAAAEHWITCVVVEEEQAIYVGNVRPVEKGD